MANANQLIVGITGATGVVYGVRILERLRERRDWETHVVVSEAGALTAFHELGMKRKDIEKLAAVAYQPRDIGAAIASGSFVTHGMVIAPCSMKTLSAVANAYGEDLITRAADVVLTERRRLVLVPREPPLNLAHLRNMIAVTEMGGIVLPPLPAFYPRPETIDDLVDHTVARVLDLFGIEISQPARWRGFKSASGGEER
jgi:polyprenyl P-hydroxybenzoate/phenylacrylic acid decarboxylase-like protein